MAKFKKIEKEFLLTDSSVNSYGFRLLTSGYLMSEYEKNPIGYYMHNREEGILVRWENLRQEDDKVFGKPSINMSHPRAQRTVDEIENGFLNAASCGHFVVLDMSTDRADMLPDQSGPTVTKWYNRECSLVDIPGNFNALKLFDKDENPINLADFTKQNKIEMKQIILTAAHLAVLNLKADADTTAVDTVLSDLVAKAQKVDQLTNDLAAAKTAKKTAEDALVALKTATNDQAIADCLAAGLKAGKITKEVSEKLKITFAQNPDGLKDLLAAMPAYKSITSEIEKSSGNAFANLSWTELDRAGKLEDLKAQDFNLFKEKYKAQFGNEYKG